MAHFPKLKGEVSSSSSLIVPSHLEHPRGDLRHEVIVMFDRLEAEHSLQRGDLISSPMHQNVIHIVNNQSNVRTAIDLRFSSILSFLGQVTKTDRHAFLDRSEVLPLNFRLEGICRKGSRTYIIFYSLDWCA